MKSMQARALALIFALLIVMIAGEHLGAVESGLAYKAEPALDSVDLERCLRAALQNNHRRPASRHAIEMAEAQHQQVLAGYWPQISLQGNYLKLDESPNFLFPASVMSYSIEGAGTIKVNVPDQDVMIMDPDLYQATVRAVWLLFDGGMRKGYREQTQGQVEVRKQEARQTDLEIIDTVTRYYYGAVLAGRLFQLGSDTLDRMEVTLRLTETLYKEGSGKVKKTDWLDNKIMVEGLRALMAQLEKNKLMARAALANAMGMSWNESVEPEDDELPHHPLAADLDDLVAQAYRFNPDWGKVEAGLAAAEGAVRTARSDHFPKVALFGNLHKWWNDAESGLSTEQNREGWEIGVGMEIAIFSGFLTQHKIAEAKARVARIKEQQVLLKDGIGLQVRDTFLSLNAAEKSYAATLAAMNAAMENRDLNTRAYQNDLVETEKVIQAQLVEAVMTAAHQKARYDHIALRSKLDLIVGTRVMQALEGR